MKTFLFILFVFTVSLYSCKDSSTNTETPGNNSGYTKVFEASSGSTRFEIYKNGSDNLTSGYNDIGFKVYVGNQEQTTGYVKFKPKGFSSLLPGGFQSCPASSKFERDVSGLFTGYVNFTFVTGSDYFWTGYFNYNDQSFADSVVFTVNNSSQAQQLMFQGQAPDTTKYYITLVAPYIPKYGLNDYKCMLHSTFDYMNFTQIDNAEISIRPWMPSMGHGSSNNVNPSYIGNGIYSGRTNLVMSGIWEVYNTIKINGNTVTSNPEPKYIFECP